MTHTQIHIHKHSHTQSVILLTQQIGTPCRLHLINYLACNLYAGVSTGVYPNSHPNLVFNISSRSRTTIFTYTIKWVVMAQGFPSFIQPNRLSRRSMSGGEGGIFWCVTRKDEYRTQSCRHCDIFISHLLHCTYLISAAPENQYH